MASSPHTPTRRRRSAHIDQTCPPHRIIQHSPTDKRSSRSFSIRSPPRGSPTFDFSNDSIDYRAESAGIGNLADELAEAWDNDCNENVQLDSVIEDQEFTVQDMATGIPRVCNHRANNSPPLSPLEQPSRSGLSTAICQTSIYDGSDYGKHLDLKDVQGIPLSLEHRLAAIDSLARRGAESNGSEADTVVMRVAESLRHLVSQAGVEAGASR